MGTHGAGVFEGRDFQVDQLVQDLEPFRDPEVAQFRVGKGLLDVPFVNERRA
jgi:hypothetical protein